MKFRFLLSYLALGIVSLTILVGVFPSRIQASSAGDVSVDMTPENPNPNENTTITLSSYTYDLNSVSISWSVNGKRIASGIAKKSFSVNAPSLGGETTVTATISLPDGDISEVSVIKPSVMIMLWQANSSYVPPFYKGKAMPSPNSEIKVVAMPEIKSGSSFVDPKKMVYSWQQDYTNNQDGSGYGKNSFIYTSDYLDGSNSVSVTAKTLDQKYSTDGSLNITTVNPKIEFYENNPVLGTLWDQAISDGYKISGNEVIQAAPYFISPKDIRIPFLTFNWSINDESISVPTYSKNLIPLTIQAGTSGTSKIGLEVENVHSLVQTAKKEINVEF